MKPKEIEKKYGKVIVLCAALIIGKVIMDIIGTEIKKDLDGHEIKKKTD